MNPLPHADRLEDHGFENVHVPRGGDLPFDTCGPIDHTPVVLDDWSRAYNALIWSREVQPTTPYRP